MKKIPTLFERDWNGDPSRVLPQVHPGCEWVLAGEGIATRKLDGTSCLVRNGKLYKRREVRQGDAPPIEFEQADFDGKTGKTVGWVPVDNGPDDCWHREAFSSHAWQADFVDGTYELIGPKIQGNPENWHCHALIMHGMMLKDDAPRTFNELRDWLATQDIEGIVWHHPDGRMAKIKLRDFGIKRVKNVRSKKAFAKPK